MRLIDFDGTNFSFFFSSSLFLVGEDVSEERLEQTCRGGCIGGNV